MIKIRYTLTLVVIISLVLPLQYSLDRFANGQIQKESDIIIYDDANSEHNTIFSSSNDNMLLKPKVDVKIEGTPQNDNIKGGEGDDKIYGNDGSDQLRGGDGDDEIDGGKGNDIIQGEDGNDKIKGGEGADRISGGLGNDQLKGELGNDKLFGGEGDDLLDGGQGNDVLLAGRGNDIMIGGPGSDTFICDQFDIIVDFDQYEEGDQIIGPCSVDYIVEEEQKEIKEKIPSAEENSNIFPIESELPAAIESEKILQLQSPSSQSSTSTSSLSSSLSQSQSSNFFDIPLPLPKADLPEEDLKSSSSSPQS